MVENQRLSERILDSYGDFGPEDEGWSLFVRDHKQWLQKKSQKRKFTPEDIIHFKYRPSEFFVHHNGTLETTWIFLFINDLRDLADFNESRVDYLIPDMNDIRDLHDLYLSSENHVELEEV